ncbi:hypothetical protein SAMN05421831_1201, partial [Allopseudospirillum japonicum]
PAEQEKARLGQPRQGPTEGGEASRQNLRLPARQLAQAVPQID